MLLLGGAYYRATAQAVSPETGETPTDQPLAGQQLGTDLTLNQGVRATNAENESFDRYGLALQAEGGAETNFFGTQSHQQTVGYASFSADGAVVFRSSRSQYYLLYQPQYNIYPQYSDVNNFSQAAFGNVNHAISEHMDLSWDTTAARYLSLTQYLPQSFTIGGIGIVVPTLESELLQNSSETTNGATSLRLRYLASAKTTFSSTLTSGYFLTVPADRTVSGLSTQRYLTSGLDMRMDYLWRPRDTVGLELTPIYVWGITPKGHDTVETLQGTYQRQLTATLSVRAAAGPLFVQSTAAGYGKLRDTSYALNASISHQTRQSQFSAGYSRAFLVNLLSPAITAHNFGVNAYLPMPKRFLFTAGGSYTHENSSGGFGGHLYGGSAQFSYLLGANLRIYALYSVLSQDLTYSLTAPNYSFTQNKFGAGIRFNLGNPTTHGGVQ